MNLWFPRQLPTLASNSNWHKLCEEPFGNRAALVFSAQLRSGPSVLCSAGPTTSSAGPEQCENARPLAQKGLWISRQTAKGFSKDRAPYSCADPMSSTPALLLCLSGSWILPRTFPHFFAILLPLRFHQWDAWVGWERPLEGMKEESICTLLCFHLCIDPVTQLLRIYTKGIIKESEKI